MKYKIRELELRLKGIESAMDYLVKKNKIKINSFYKSLYNYNKELFKAKLINEGWRI